MKFIINMMKLIINTMKVKKGMMKFKKGMAKVGKKIIRHQKLKEKTPAQVISQHIRNCNSTE